MKNGFSNFMAVMVFVIIATLGQKLAGVPIVNNLAIVILWTLLEIKDLLKDVK